MDIFEVQEFAFQAIQTARSITIVISSCCGDPL
jgi:hypothetical protein